MPISENLHWNGQTILTCACGSIVDGLYRGNRWDYEEDRSKAVNRWLCEQCRGNIVDDGGNLKLVKRYPVSGEQEEAWEDWYIKEGQYR